MGWGGGCGCEVGESSGSEPSRGGQTVDLELGLGWVERGDRDDCGDVTRDYGESV